jgi:hypothetical protein
MDDNKATPVETLFEMASDYSKTTLELVKLNAIDKSADIVSSLAAQLVIAIVVAMFVLMVNMGIALWIGELLGKSYYGFFVVAGCYTVIVMLIYAFRYPLIKIPVSNFVITQMLKQRTV